MEYSVFGLMPMAVKMVEDGDGVRWLSYGISRNGEVFQVKEHITCPASGRIWPEISAWFWHALFHPGDGPWEAMTVILM